MYRVVEAVVHCGQVMFAAAESRGMVQQLEGRVRGLGVVGL